MNLAAANFSRPSCRLVNKAARCVCWTLPTALGFVDHVRAICYSVADFRRRETITRSVATQRTSRTRQLCSHSTPEPAPTPFSIQWKHLLMLLLCSFYAYSFTVFCVPLYF